MIEGLGEDVRAFDRERIARGDDGLDAGAMEGLSDAAEVVAEVAIVAAVARSEDDEAEPLCVRREDLPQAPAVNDLHRAAFAIEREAVGRAATTAVAEKVEYGEGLARGLSAGKGLRQALGGGVGEDIGGRVEAHMALEPRAGDRSLMFGVRDVPTGGGPGEEHAAPLGSRRWTLLDGLGSRPLVAEQDTGELAEVLAGCADGDQFPG